MWIQKIKNKLDQPITWADIKPVVSSLDNIFTGGMVLGSIMMLHWLWLVMGIWLIILPVSYVALCYLGMYINTYIKSKQDA